jgi:hypothetical protein
MPPGADDRHVAAADHPARARRGTHDFACVAPGKSTARGRDASGEHDRIEVKQGIGVGAQSEAHVDTGLLESMPEVAQRLVEFLLARDALREVELTADLVAASNRVTRWPRAAASVAQASPAGPAPTTAMRRGEGACMATISVSAQARGFTRQLARLFSNTWSRHGLVARDAGVDREGAAGTRLVRPLRIGEQRARHRHHVRTAGGEDGLRRRRAC